MSSVVCRESSRHTHSSETSRAIVRPGNGTGARKKVHEKHFVEGGAGMYLETISEVGAGVAVSYFLNQI